MIVLDTHILIWFLTNSQKLSKKAKKLIDESVSRNQVLVSSISIWEICMLVSKGRLTLSMDLDSWIKKIEELPFIRFMPIDNKIATKAVNLVKKLPQDPADRMIISTTLVTGAKLVTSDKKILKHLKNQVVW